jgi:hypothetical protein
MRDVAGQLANISGALQFLNTRASTRPANDITSRSATLLSGEAELLHDSRDADHAREKTQSAWNQWRRSLGRLESLYPADTVKTEVYICPMHPFDRHLNASEKCSICGMSLVRRHLPASAVYQMPGEPTLKMTAICQPLVVGPDYYGTPLPTTCRGALLRCRAMPSSTVSPSRQASRPWPL